MCKCPYRRADSIRDRRPTATADYRMGIHPQLATVDLAVYGDLAVGRDVILNNPPVLGRLRICDYRFSQPRKNRVRLRLSIILSPVRRLTPLRGRSTLRMSLARGGSLLTHSPRLPLHRLARCVTGRATPPRHHLNCQSQNRACSSTLLRVPTKTDHARKTHTCAATVRRRNAPGHV